MIVKTIYGTPIDTEAIVIPVECAALSPSIRTFSKNKLRYFMQKLEAGDSIFIFTDGVKEAVDETGRFFGEERMLETLNNMGSVPPGAVIGSMGDKIDSYAGSGEQFDDITMLCLRFMGRKDG